MIYNHLRLQSVMCDNCVDLVIATTKQNIKYFSGFIPVIKELNPYYGQCYVVINIKNIEQINIVHSIGEIDQILDSQSPVGAVNCYGEFYREDRGIYSLTKEENRLKVLSDISHSFVSADIALINMVSRLCQGKIKKIGIDEDGIGFEILKSLKQAFPKISFLPFSQEIRKVRMIKTAYEINMLTKAARSNEDAIRFTTSKLREGMNETDIAQLFNQGLVANGSFPVVTMLKIGRAAVGGQRKQKKEICLSPGDLIWFDSDAIYDGFWSDISRTLIFKEGDSEYDNLYSSLQGGMVCALKNIKAGMVGRDIFNLITNKVNENETFNYRRHHVGHGIGLEPYEYPLLNSTNETLIENGMVLSIETPYYEFGLGALHIESLLLINENGNEVLTKEWAPNIKIIGV